MIRKTNINLLASVCVLVRTAITIVTTIESSLELVVLCMDQTI